MKKVLILSLLITLIGCTTTAVPVAVKFPDAPDQLKKPCPDLQTVDPATNKLTDVLGAVVGNYSMYYECKGKTDDWIEWYGLQKSIFDKLK